MQGKFCHITPVLHQLPVSFCINFKILPLTFKAIHELAPSYINDLAKIKPLHLRYRLQSNDRMLLSYLNLKTVTTLGDRAFVASAPNLQNNLPLEIRCLCTYRYYWSWLATYPPHGKVDLYFLFWNEEEYGRSEDHAHLPVCSNVSTKRLQLYRDVYSHQRNGSRRDINSFLSLFETFSLIVLNWHNS